MPFPSHPTWLDHSNYIIIIKHLCYVVRLRPLNFRKLPYGKQIFSEFGRPCYVIRATDSVVKCNKNKKGSIRFTQRRWMGKQKMRRQYFQLAHFALSAVVVRTEGPQRMYIYHFTFIQLHIKPSHLELKCRNRLPSVSIAWSLIATDLSHIISEIFASRGHWRLWINAWLLSEYRIYKNFKLFCLAKNTITVQ
jgi:hypothetical protein